LVSVCGLVLFGPLSLLGFTANTQEVVGTAILQHGEITDGGTIPYVMVRLSDGQVVRARYDVTIPFRRDRQIILKETTTMFFGYKWYKFLRYIERPSQPNSIHNLL
jgi:hypothetical protein